MGVAQDIWGGVKSAGQGIGKFLFGSDPEIQQLQNLNPQQQQLLQQLLSGGMGNLQGGQNYLSKLFGNNSEDFSDFENPFITQFNEQTVPGLAERFSGMGARNSSAFTQALGQAGAGLSQNLASLRGNLRQNALGHTFGQAQLGLGTSPFNYLQQPGTQGLVPGAINSFASGFGRGFGG